MDLNDGRAVFGRNVLARLVSELENAAQRPRTDRRWGPGVLGCAMWMDNPELIDALGTMANACVVVTKQQRSKYSQEVSRQLTELADRAGLAHAAYPELSQLAPLVGGRPLVVGPGSPRWDDADIGAVRELGYRKVGNRLVPIVHAKILLLGRMCWTDEGPGGVDDVLYFVPEKLWIGSANFTKSSRKSLEMGMWTTDSALLSACRTWLLELIGMSEAFGQSADLIEPELVPVEYDDAALIEYLNEVGCSDPGLADEDTTS